MSALASHGRRPTPPVDVTKLRKRMERAVERMIAALDALDADAEDLEGGDLEPSLGAPEQGRCYPDQSRWACSGDTGEREAEDEHGGDVNDEPQGPDVEGEPALGWTEHVDQEKAFVRDPAIWACSDEAEPGLGAPEHPHDQRRWAQGKPAEVGYRPLGRPENRYPDAPDQAARKALCDLRGIGVPCERQRPTMLDGITVTMLVK